MKELSPASPHRRATRTRYVPKDSGDMHFNQPCGLDKLTQVTFTATGKLITRGPVRQVGGAL